MNDRRAGCASVKALLMDVDGVLTDGRILLGEDGVERRGYYARDGIGIRIGQAAGIKFGLVTSSKSEGIRTRAERLGIDVVCIGVRDKAAELENQARAMGIDLADIAFIGDDVVDIPAMALAGLSFAVADAEPAVRSCADIVTVRPGGAGAVREACEMLVAARAPELLAEIAKCGLRL